MSPTAHGQTLAAWWGFAEADRLILGLVVLVLAIVAVSYLVMRARTARALRRAAGARTGRRT